ncbi:hypothetical protein HYH03_006147 [Edaphochlamys debaryana]|uniref:Phosphate transporter n=1 Tax=Edaphochlamys debaryana TaxID=47281 RepID=A0A836C0N2_9CHLO|nr:hypothetical protein HYH03_006147 [Edaphochlamys debaryana]|eukprot:KAG2495910.1 hypothetical protein HYH03_006147 [Edaphochlamys debaryana]
MWLVIVGFIVSFIMAAGIGANDVANAFGTSVGAKTITLKQACLIAAVFEFAGAVGLGGEVTKTIAGSIARPAAFQAQPEIFMYGMMVALIAASSWVFTATYFCLAVSTTHSVIGAVLGFALVWGGSGAVVWNDKMDEFPYSKGLVPVICSWFVSPLCSGIASAIIFFCTRFFVLRRENSTNLAIYCYPLLVAVTVFINVFFVIYKGAKNVAGWSSDKAAWVAGAIAGGCFLVACFPGIWILRKVVARDMERAAQKAADAEAAANKTADDVEEAEPEPSSKAMKMFNSLKRAATRGLNKDIHQHVETNQEIHDMHAAAEVFTPETEQVFKYLQVFSACAVSFAHGANDVANAVGPFSGIWYVYRNWTISSSGDTPVWVLAMGGAGIVVGLATYGYNIMMTLGVGLAKMTPSRGYSAEIATSFAVSLASVYGLPVSTTQCITGAEMGVGLVENVRTGVNWKLFAKQILAWVFTLFVSALVSAAIFAYGVYAPSITMSKDITKYEDGIRSMSQDLYKVLTASNLELNRTYGYNDTALNSTIAKSLTTYSKMFDTKKIGYIDPDQLLAQLNSSLVTYANYSVVVTGYNRSTKAVIPEQMPPEYWTDYMWLVIVGFIVSFIMAAGIGANDVANAFGTSVGAKTITLRQACLIAAVFEFAGAIGLGGEVTKTIAGSIARPAAFQAQPEIFMYGMMVALIAASSWVFTATYFCLAVSTTHAVIGAVMGFALVWGGSGAVVWNDHQDAFPYSKGLVPVICSWFVSPIMSGIVSAFIFVCSRFFILRRENSTNLAIYCYPLLVAVTVFINVFFVIYKGAKNVAGWSSDKAAWVAGVIAGGCFLVACFPGIWILRKVVARDMERAAQKAAEAEAAANKPPGDEEAAPEQESSKAMKMFNSLKRAATRGLNQDIHAHVENNQDVHDMHAAAEVFSPETEQVFKYLQVFSACAVSFSHGANDVANAVGPFSGIWFVYRNWYVSATGDTPVWVLAMGGAGIVVGLATYGYNIMMTLGVGLAKMTPCRGYAAEIATSFTISLASVYGLPVSTTQCITGGEMGVGLVENVRTGINWKLLAKQVLAWIFTLIVSGFVSAAIFAYGVYAPSITMSKDITKYEDGIRSMSQSLYKVLNGSNLELNRTYGFNDTTLNATIAKGFTTYSKMFDTKKIGYIDPEQLLAQLNTSLVTYANYSVVVTGYNRSTKAVIPDPQTVPGPLESTQVQVQPFSQAALTGKPAPAPAP